MLKEVTLTQHVTVERWDSWIVSVPDNMCDERIEQLIREMWENGELKLDEEEYQDEDDPNVDISDVTPSTTAADLTFTEHGLVDGDITLTSFTTEMLQKELDRRQARDNEIIVV